MESAHTLFRNLFFNAQKYNFSRIGRLKFNIKLGLETSLEEKILQPQDYVEVIKYLLKLRKGEGAVDDIDHLGNRRVRQVGELVENAFRIGLTRMERTIKEKMTITADLAAAMPQDLINSKPVIAALKEFFGSSQLSQFMDQINSLAEVTHKRRLSALGPRRPEPGAGRVRGPRHPVQPLRPHLPDRDAGRPEHRPHLVPELLRPDQRLRLHRDPLPRGQGTAGSSTTSRSCTPATASARSARSSRRTRPCAKSPRSSARGPSTCPSSSRTAST